MAMRHARRPKKNSCIGFGIGLLYTCVRVVARVIAVWFNALPRSEQVAMRKRLAADFTKMLYCGEKYRAPRGHAAVVKGA